MDDVGSKGPQDGSVKPSNHQMSCVRSGHRNPTTATPPKISAQRAIQQGALRSVAATPPQPPFTDERGSGSHIGHFGLPQPPAANPPRKGYDGNTETMLRSQMKEYLIRFQSNAFAAPPSLQPPQNGRHNPSAAPPLLETFFVNFINPCPYI